MNSLICAIPVLASLLGSCPSEASRLSGYVEGEFVSLAPAASARILEITVRRGDRVEKGALLARLDAADALIARDQAEARVAAARAEAGRARLDLSRTRELAGRNVAAQASLDAAQATLDAAEARVKEAEAALSHARWLLGERELKAEEAGVVDDVLRHGGDMAGPGQPVISFLPDGAVKLKLYAPGPMLPALANAETLEVACDGCPPDLKARISFIAKEPEFTPPVIYSVERRQKLVYLVEARPLAADAALRPGMIVDAGPAAP